MIQHDLHETTGTTETSSPAETTRGLPAARIHAASDRPLPEISVPELMGLRIPAGHRTHRHKVPLRRLTAVRG
ncbi:hypothetical protein [Streptomyces tropicalis]|uniref:Uncharacterized protein n=1 Tax=Streptomyces tropicalis TaxID=3034234 RepID=A0ABT6A6P9_9ACTN|nr:hypothetical protein [Streptomyces tropicalis]MDF3300329.1 hypothetical protein [Streptomyces tropicalis]